MTGLADLVGLVGLEPVQRIAVLVREDRDRSRAQLAKPARNALIAISPRLATSTLRNIPDPFSLPMTCTMVSASPL